MPGELSKRGVWPTIFAGVSLLVVAYVGVYWWLVEPINVGSHRDWVIVPHYGYYFPGDPETDVAFDRWLSSIFAPAHWTDRYLVRTQLWDRHND